ncbi:MAG TPA: hypothetical protein VEB21_07755 [Terriglobales bacterium]|nr:hypothetical protein [Terriglobales bacterium]
MSIADGLTGSVAGARFRLVCDDDELREYARVHLMRCLEGTTAVDVEVVLRWHDGAPPARPERMLAAMRRVDRDLYLGDTSIRWYRVDDLRDLWLAFEWDGRQLRVEGDFHFRVANSERSDRLRRWLVPRQTTAQRRRRYTTLLYYLVYYPCWWWLEHTGRMHPIHAAGVASASGVTLLAGGSGIGKSTLAVALAAQPGAQLLADSFVLHHQRQVRPVREPLLIDDQSRKWLGDACARLEPIAWSYLLNRGGYHMAAGQLGGGGVASRLLFPRRAPQAYVRPLDQRRAAALLSAGDMVINDLRRYWAFAAVLEYLAGDGLMMQREQNIRGLTAAVPSYEIGLTLSHSRLETVAAIEGLATAAA